MSQAGVCASLISHCAGQQPAARSIGTTVTIKELFKTLPVRYKTFQRNVKKEYVKLVQQLQAYAIIATSVKLLATNQVSHPLSACGSSASGTCVTP
jgi:DNA mismatch repair ATPase MutL